MAREEAEHKPYSAEKIGASANPPSPRRRWESIVEQQIAEARDQGAFENLRGQGQPLRLEANPYAKEKALAYSVLKNNHMAPPEIERAKEIAEDLHRADALLARLRFQRDRLRARAVLFSSDRRSYNVLLAGTEQRYVQALAAINSKILSLNLSAPTALHLHMINIEARLQEFHRQFALEETS